MSLNGSLSKSTGLSGSLSGSYNYEQFTNKPKINGVELTGNKSFEDLGLPKQVQADYTQNDETQPDYIKNRPLVALSTLVTEETSDISANIDLKGVLTYRYQTIHIYNDTSYNMVQFLYGGKVIDHVSADGYSYIYVEKYTDIENLLFDIKFYGFDIKCEVADGELNVVTDIATNNNEVLLRDNKEEYIPTTDYSPATKRYVDDSVDKLKEGLAEKVPNTDYAPELKTDIMTQPVGKDSNGKLWTAPGSGGSGIAVTGATVGQTIKIAAVDDDGVPTAWESVDFPSGGNWRKIADLTTTEDVKEILISQDMNGQPFALKEVRIATYAAAAANGTGYDYCSTEINGSSIVVGQNSNFNTSWYYRYAYYSVSTDGTGFGWFVSTNNSAGANPNFNSLSCRSGSAGLTETNHGFPITSVGFKHSHNAGLIAAGAEMVVYGIDA